MSLFFTERGRDEGYEGFIQLSIPRISKASERGKKIVIKVLDRIKGRGYTFFCRCFVAYFFGQKHFKIKENPNPRRTRIESDGLWIVNRTVHSRGRLEALPEIAQAI